MDRRQFVAAVGGAALTASARSEPGQADEPRNAENSAPGTVPENALDRESIWLPLNCWHVEHYNHHRGEHVMITRPGWGDRRIAVQTSPDARKWSNLELLMQLDALDVALLKDGKPIDREFFDF